MKFLLSFLWGWELLLLDYLGNLSRIFTSLSSNAVSHCRRSAQALLTLASPSAQASQAAPFWWLIMIYTI
jgi:hypothetical protein